MTSEEFKIQMMPLKDRLYRFASNILSDADDAADVVQDTFLKLWTKREKLSEVRNLEAFAMVTVRNLSLDRIKSFHNRNVSRGLDLSETSGTNPGDLAEIKDSAEKAKMIIARLPETQRTVIHLRDVEEMELAEIAEIMKINLNAVRVNLSRARKTVRENLMNLYQYEHRGIKNING